MPGPYVQLAAICEKVLQEPDGVLSLIRVIDRVMVHAQGEEAPTELPAGRLALTLVVTLKSDDARGRHPVTLNIQQPSGISLPPQTLDVMFEGEERGVNLILQFQLDAIEGLYWFDVSLRDALLTRIPLRVMYQRVGGPA